MPKLTTEELVLISMKKTMDSPEDQAKLKDFVNWLSRSLTERDIPAYIAITAFAVMTEGVRVVNEIAVGSENEDVVQ